MKRGKALLLALLAGVVLGAAVWTAELSGGAYHREDAVTENGATFYLRRDGRAAFAGTLAWDGQGDTIDYTIPDTVDGAPVTALGGLLYGTAFKSLPTGWGVTLPEVYRGAALAQYTLPTNARELTLTVRLHIGRYVASIEPIGLLTPAGYYGGGADDSYILRQEWVVTCDEENPVYYAENGRLYHRGDGSPVDISYETA